MFSVDDDVLADDEVFDADVLAGVVVLEDFLPF